MRRLVVVVALAVAAVGCSPLQTVRFPVREADGRSVEVEKYYSSLTPDDPGDRSFNQLAQGKRDEAVATLRAAVAASPTDSSYHYDIAIIDEMKGDWHDALKEIREAKRLRPGDRSYAEEEAFVVSHGGAN